MSLRERVHPTCNYQTQPQVPVPKWEYAVVQFSDLAGSLLNESLATMGSYGWELCESRVGGIGVSRHHADTGVVLIFKRQAS